jgi:hypothetical protein
VLLRFLTPTLSDDLDVKASSPVEVFDVILSRPKEWSWRGYVVLPDRPRSGVCVMEHTLSQVRSKGEPVFDVSRRYEPEYVEQMVVEMWEYAVGKLAERKGTKR